MEVLELLVQPKNERVAQHLALEQRFDELVGGPCSKEDQESGRMNVVDGCEHITVVVFEGLMLVAQPFALSIVDAEGICGLVPEKIGLDVRGPLGTRYAQRLRGQLIVATLAQIQHLDHFALPAEGDGETDVLSREPEVIRFAALGHAVVIAVERLEDGHAATPSARQRFTSRTPSTRRARKKRDVWSFAKSMSCSIQPRSRAC